VRFESNEALIRLREVLEIKISKSSHLLRSSESYILLLIEKKKKITGHSATSHKV
jgi:hypothetical protein